MRSPRVQGFASLALVVLVSCFALPAAPPPPSGPAASSLGLDIPYQKFELENGLTLLVHEDHKAPIVAVNLWYHVGSKNEKPGKTGFAHLFEHLMFNGSENYDDDYFKVMDRLGATTLNGTTNEDRTNYFENVPVSALDTVLWMESDRMGHLLGAVTQAKLDEQRGVVQNEKRQGENEPYSVSEELITKAVFPAGHPYSWTVIGSMEDLKAASLDDAKEWFRTYYGAANAVIVIAGDIDAKTALEKVKLYFGDIPAGPPVAHHEAWIAKRSGVQRQRVQDRVPQARLYKVWNVPGWGTPDADALQLAARVLASGKSSRLYKRLVYDEQLATSVTAYLDSREIGGLFQIEATARPGGDLAAIERAVDEELARFLALGPTPEELLLAQMQVLSGVVRTGERIGGFGGKSDLLARGLVFTGNPDAYKLGLERTRRATSAQLKDAAVRWLSDGVYALEVHPFPTYDAAKAGADRKALPSAGDPPAARFPEVERATLSSGLEIAVAERHAVPVVNLTLMVDAGFAADQLFAPGTASLALAMLDEGTKTKDSIEISDTLQRLGAQLSTESTLDTSNVTLSALRPNLDASLALFGDVVLNPVFPQADFDRLKKQQIAGIQAEKVSPISMALRVFPRLLYGKGHAYGNPLTGSGYEDSVARIDRAALVRFHQTWFKPNHATLIVVGDTTLAEIKPKLEALFRAWTPGDVPAKNLAEVALADKPVLYLVDRPGSIQSIVFAGHVAPPTANPDEVAIETMNTVFGGSFTSRINMNLREDKHWSYGSGSFLVDAVGQRPLILYAPVQTDKTKESMQELATELAGILGAKPVTPDELAKAQDAQTRTLSGAWETSSAVNASIQQLVRFGLPDDYFETYPTKVRSLGVEAVSTAAGKTLHPNGLVWVVVGDLSKIEAGVRELDWGEIRRLDADGNPVP